MVNWLPVIGYEGYYEVSDQGEIRSLDRRVKRGAGWLTIKGRTIKPWRVPPGNYLTVGLSLDGDIRRVRVHRIVLEAFHGPAPEGHIGCHNNGVIDDLRAENLRWDTKSANALDSVAHGTNFNANKEACKRGHSFTPENTYINPTSKGRQCKQCVRDARFRKV